MKIQIKNNNGIIVDAYTESINDLSMSLIINTSKRYAFPDSHSCSKGEYGFEFFNDDDSDFDQVLLLAETEKEEKELSRLVFELHSKQQLWFLFLDKSVYQED